jgi:integrase
MPCYHDNRSGRLYIQFERDGQLYKKRLPEGATRKEAEVLETKWKHDIFFAAHLPEEKESVLWERFVEDVYFPYVKANNSEQALEKAIVICKAAMPFFGNRALDEIKPADVEQFKQLRMETRTHHGTVRKPATIHREMSIISKIFSLALKNDLVRYNPVSRVDMPKFDNVQNAILPLEYEEDFLWSMYKLQRDLCTTALYTGLRQTDLFGLSKDQVDFRTDEIFLVQGKTKRRVSIPLLPRLRTMLLSRLDDEGDLFFPSYRTGRKLTSINNSIRNASSKFGLKLTIFDLRRTFGTRLHENGFDDKTIADLLGHVGLRCVHRYKRGTEIKRKAILSLENMVPADNVIDLGDFQSRRAA